MDNHNQVDLARNGLDIFNGMSDVEVREATLALNGMVHSFSKADYINFAEDWVNVIAVILSGSINIIAEDILGHNAILSSLNRGSAICEKLFKSKSSVAISFLVASDSEILMLPVENMQELSNDNGMLAKLFFNICLMMANDSMRLVEKINILNQRFLRDKILAYLRMLYNKNSVQK